MEPGSYFIRKKGATGTTRTGFFGALMLTDTWTQDDEWLGGAAGEDIAESNKAEDYCTIGWRCFPVVIEGDSENMQASDWQFFLLSRYQEWHCFNSNTRLIKSYPCPSLRARREHKRLAAPALPERDQLRQGVSNAHQPCG